MYNILHTNVYNIKGLQLSLGGNVFILELFISTTYVYITNLDYDFINTAANFRLHDNYIFATVNEDILTKVDNV